MDVLKKYFLLLILLCGCTTPDKPAEEEATAPVSIVVTNAPLLYFTQRLAPPHAKIHFPMWETSDPAYWEISADSVAAMQESALILMNGADYETWATNVSLPVSRVVYSIDDKDDLIALKNTVTHSHGDEGEHSHDGTASTTWMDFQLAAKQAQRVADALKATFPNEAGSIDERISALTADLKNLHQSMLQAADTSGYYVFSHPVYQYLQRAYGIKGESVHWEPEITLTHDQLHDLEHTLDHHKVKAVIWENSPSGINLQKLDSMGVKSIVFRPAGGWEQEYDFIHIMQSNIDELE